MCVCERERERCVCVCVCERERESPKQFLCTYGYCDVWSGSAWGGGSATNSSTEKEEGAGGRGLK